MLPQAGALQATVAALLLQLVLSTDPLLTVLCREGFTEFSRLLEGPAGASIRNACPRRIIVFAPTNDAIARASSCSLSRRDDPPTPDQYACPADQAVPGPIVVKRRSTITTTPGAVALLNFLNDPQWVNLGPGQNSSVVQKNVPNAGLGTVLTGLGNVVKITGLDIPFECGVIRPVSGTFTLPRLLSETLPVLGLDKALDALQRTGLLAEVDGRPGITFLAPDDTVFPDLPVDQLADLLRRHILVGPPAYTPTLDDGESFTTLAGTTVRVTVNGPEYLIGGARILAGDAIIKNGVIHTVDRIITDGGSASGSGSGSGSGSAPATPTTTRSATATSPASTIVTAGAALSASLSVSGVVGMLAAVVGYHLV